MKKVLLVVLALVLALGCISSFADLVKFDKAASAIGKSFNDGTIQYDVNEIRSEWTPSRAMEGTIADFVNIGSDAEKDIAVAVEGTEFVTIDNACESETMYFSISYKAEAFGDFIGAAIDCDRAGYDASTTEFDYSNITATGYGFSVVGQNTVQMWVSPEKGLEVDKCNFTVPFDTQAGLHTYSIYKEDQLVHFYADAIEVGYFDFRSSTPAEQRGIYDAEGNALIVGKNSGSDFEDSYYGGIMFAMVGDNVKATFDNVDIESAYDALPETTEKAVVAEVIKSADPTPAPETEAPKPTEAPATEAPATEAPAEATPDNTEKKGCGGFIAGGAFAVLALAAVVIKKRED